MGEITHVSKHQTDGQVSDQLCTRTSRQADFGVDGKDLADFLARGVGVCQQGKGSQTRHAAFCAIWKRKTEANKLLEKDGRAAV
jgi:hypothetical protein